MKKRLERLLTEAFQLGASDIHLTVGVPPTLRINGLLQPMEDEVLKPSDTEQMAKSMVADELWRDFQKRGELDFSFGIPNVSRFRINTYYQRSSVCLAIRVVPTKIPSLEDLYMPSVLQEISRKPHGLILVTGPTGSGKSTTLAAMIDHINANENKHIITLEDPIEYLHRHKKSIVNQREVGFDTQTFANGLRACLRQDPDIILVGEMRDLETIGIAITAAETGHLVLGTLHTTDAASTIDRMIDVFPPTQQPQVRIQLASALEAVISQRLFKTSKGNGRRAATEILINNSAIKNLIRNKKTHQIQSVMQTSKASGMHTLDMSMNDLVNQQIVSLETIAAYKSESVH